MKIERRDLGALRLAQRVGEHPADLRRSAAHVDAAHEVLEPLPAGDEIRSPAFVETAEIDELDVEAAERRRGFEHFRLKRLGEIPGRLPAHGGVEGEDQPAAAGSAGCGNLFRRLDEGGDVLSPVAPCERAVLVPVHRRTPVSVCLALKLGALTHLTSRPQGKTSPDQRLGSLPRRHQRHHRPLQFVGQGRPGRDLVGRRAPFHHAPDGEAGVDQRVQRRA